MRLALDAIRSAVVLLLATSTSLQAQDRGTIRVTATRADSGEPISAVQISVDGTGLGGLTARDGVVTVTGVPAGRAVVRATVMGFADTEEVVEVAPGATVTLGLELGEQAIDLGGVVAMVRRAQSVTKSQIETRFVPQAVAVVPREFIEEQQIRTLVDATRNVSGVVVNAEYLDGSSYSVRGFGQGFFASFRRNAREMPNWTDPLNANVERVEVLKGPSSVLFGSMEPGGIINLVTKKPLATPLAEIQLDYGTLGTLSPRVDFSGPLGTKRVLYRLNASYARLGSFRNEVEADQYFVAPHLSVALSDRVSLSVEGEWKRQETVYDPGLIGPGAMLDDPVWPGGTEVFYGEPSAIPVASHSSVASVLDWTINPGWSLRYSLSTTRFDEDIERVYTDSYDTSQDLVNRGYLGGSTEYDYLQSDLALYGRFGLLGVGHTASFGVEYTHTDADNVSRNTAQFVPYIDFLSALTGLPLPPLPGTDVLVQNPATLRQMPAVSATNPSFTGLPDPADRFTLFSQRGWAATLAFFIQDQLELTDRLRLTLAGRMTRLDREVDRQAPYEGTPQSPADLALIWESSSSIDVPGFGPIPIPDEDPETGRGTLRLFPSQDVQERWEVSPSTGLVFEVSETVTAYGSFSRSFRPEYVNVDSLGNAFDPVLGEQFEMGTKARWFDGRLAADFSMYHITKENALTRVPGSGFFIQTGEQRSRGVEVDVLGAVTDRLTLAAVYALNEAEVTVDADASIVGNRLPAAPKHSGSLWASLGLSDAVGVHGGVRFVSDRAGSVFDTYAMGGYAVADIGAAYRMGSYRIQAKVTNLFDTDYVTQGGVYGTPSQTWGYPGAPRSLFVTVSWRR